MRATLLLQAIFITVATASRQRQSRAEPCAIVSSSVKAFLAASPTATPVIDAKLGYDCLNSAPLHKGEARKLVESILPFVEFQSTIEYMKSPPPGYLLPAVDIRAGFQAILQNVSDGAYTSEYEFQAAILKLVNSVHDAHFRFLPDLLSKAITFSRPLSLVSVSIDGKASPKIYTTDDVKLSETANGIPSAIATINGQDVYKALEELSLLGRLNDPDALYNAVFFSPAMAGETAGFQGWFAHSGSFRFFYPGANTTIKFENETTITVQNLASVIGDFSNVSNGASLYNTFCSGAANSLPSTTTSTTSSLPQPDGYPNPIIISSDGNAGGYYLPNSDVAVLALLSFEPDVPVEWQQVIEEFLTISKADGKKKLVIDLSANGGGLILQGYDTFRQLFPQIVQDGNTRFRMHQAFSDISTATSNGFPPNFDPLTSSNANLTNSWETTPNYRYDVNIDNQLFPDYPSKFGPVQFNGDNFTNIIRWNLNDPLTTINETFGLGEEITGYGSRTNFTQTYAAEDIIMVYDGYCASTCTIFSEFMRTQAGVKSIALGGRSTSDGEPTPLIQGVGGVKGANNYGYGYISSLASAAVGFGARSKAVDQLINQHALTRSTDTSINVRDNILKANLGDGVPSHFIYEPADCRLFYTPAMIKNVTAIWEAAASSAWGGAACNAGSLPRSTGTRSSRSMWKSEAKITKRDTEVVRLSGLKTSDRDARWLAENVMDAPK